MTKKMKGLMIALLLVAFALRIVDIDAVPPGLSGDESMNGADAIDVWDREQLPVFFTGNYGREAFFFYLMALSVKVLGVSAFTIRLPAIFCGMVSLVCAYVFVKRLWSERVALLTVGLLSVSFWPIFTSRVGLRAVSMLPWETLCLYALWRGLHERKWVWWGVSGVALGVLPYTYIPGRFFSIVPLTWLGTCAIFSVRRPWDGARRWQVWGGALLAVVVAVLIFAPFGRFIVQHPRLANQRINELTGVLQQLRAGNMRPLLQAIVRTLGMFTFVGEGDWYYNVSGRPLFDWGTGLFFYIGVLLALFRLREPRCQLLLIWAGVMLAPGMLSTGAPSFLRVIGAQVPLYVFPALACDRLWQWLDGYNHRPNAPVGARYLQRWFGWCVSLAIAFVALRDGRAYFVDWVQSPRTRQIYNVGLAQIGTALNNHSPMPENSRVFVGCDYALDLCRNMVGFQTRYTGPIQWFIGRHAMLFPQAESTQGDLFYFFGNALPPDAILQPLAQLGTMLTDIRSANGALESASLHIPASRWDQHPWSPQTPLSGQFQNAIAMFGYDMPAHVERGNELALTAYWRVPDTFDVDSSAPLYIGVILRDVDENIWEKHSSLLPYAQWDWIPGDIVAQMLELMVSPDIPPITLYPAITLERNGQVLPYHLPSGEIVKAAALKPLQVTGTPTATLPASYTFMGLEQEIALGEVLMIGMSQPGERLSSTLYWYALQSPHTEYVVRFQWHQGDCAGPVVYAVSEPLLAVFYPTTRWQAGEPLRSMHAPIIPRELANGVYHITLDLVPTSQLDLAQPAAATVCRPLVLSGRARTFADLDQVNPADFDIANPHIQALSDGVRLLGYNRTPPGTLRPGDTLEVTLYWQATALPSTGYTVFVHLYRPDGQLAGQHDSPPCGNACPTFSWIAGEILEDKHTFIIDPASEPGDYRLGVGMYDSTTLTRLAIPETDDNVILLSVIPVNK